MSDIDVGGSDNINQYHKAQLADVDTMLARLAALRSKD
jgi:hypothetical protein